MAIFVVSICGIWKVSIFIDYDTSSTWAVELDGTDGGRTWRTRGARCTLGTRTCNRVAWVVPSRKGRSAMDSIAGGGAIDSVTSGGTIDFVTNKDWNIGFYGYIGTSILRIYRKYRRNIGGYFFTNIDKVKII